MTDIVTPPATEEFQKGYRSLSPSLGVGVPLPCPAKSESGSAAWPYGVSEDRYVSHTMVGNGHAVGIASQITQNINGGAIIDHKAPRDQTLSRFSHPARQIRRTQTWNALYRTLDSRGTPHLQFGSTFAPMGIFPPACTAAAILAMSIGGAGLMVATSKAGLVWAKAAVVARTARQHNVTVNLFITVLFDFRRNTTASRQGNTLSAVIKNHRRGEHARNQLKVSPVPSILHQPLGNLPRPVGYLSKAVQNRGNR
jgi:hypothetical protein